MGHTKFSPDWCFGLLKQKFRRTRVDCLDGIVKVVNESAVVNHAHLVGTQSRQVVVPTYNWSNYLGEHLLKIPLITRQHHFQFLSTGEVIIREYSNSPETKLNLLKDSTWRPASTALPPIILPSGLFSERQAYLYEKIRNTALQKPETWCALTQSTSISHLHIQHHQIHLHLMLPPPPNRQRTCGYCGHYHHNKRTCKNRENQ